MTAVGAAIGCIAGSLLIVLIVVLVLEKRKKDSKKEVRVYDDVPSQATESQSQKGSELNGQVYENIHAHTNTGFVDELNDIICKNAKSKTAPAGNTDSSGAATAICDDDTYYEDSEPVRLENLEPDHSQANNIYVNNKETPEARDTSVAAVNGSCKPRTAEKTKRSRPQPDLQKAQQLYENAAFPVKYSRIATPRICERSLQVANPGNASSKRGCPADTVQPVLHKLERPKVAARSHVTTVSDNELIYDDVPDEADEDEQLDGAAPVKPPLKPKPRMSKILRHNKNKSKTPSPRLKPAEDTIMVDNDVYTVTS